jgi:hypothetical protein
VQHEPRTRHELRCFCARKPLLAMYGVDKHDKLYVHVRIYKASRVFGEVVVTEGTVHLRCRECFRWQRVIIVEPGHARLRTEPKPQMLHHDSVPAASLPPSDTPS